MRTVTDKQNISIVITRAMSNEKKKKYMDETENTLTTQKVTE